MNWRVVCLIVAVFFMMACDVFCVLALLNRRPEKQNWSFLWSHSWQLSNPDDFTAIGWRYRTLCVRCFAIAVAIGVLIFASIYFHQPARSGPRST